MSARPVALYIHVACNRAACGLLSDSAPAEVVAGAAVVAGDVVVVEAAVVAAQKDINELECSSDGH